MNIRSLSSIPPHHLLAGVAAMLLAWTLWGFLRASPPPEPSTNTDLYAQLGGQAAEKTLTLVNRGGSVLIIEPRLFGPAATGVQAMIHAYERALRKGGVSVAARESVTLPVPSEGPREEPWTLLAMQERHPKVSAIASFAGLPVNPMVRGELVPLLAFCAEPVDARAILRRGEANIVIAPRPTTGESPGQAVGIYAILTAGDL
ncbi:MAG TPA: hypothetical protein PKE12_15235 [Kiritimatiellia bacterium]|mgnify:CR=1 FL=1|nr:hypothetical protein [Kiritimatiellia bacterium]